MFKSLQPAFIITRREVRDQLRDWRIIFPVIGLTLFFPFLMNFTAEQILNFVSERGATIIGERLIPFLFMIVGFFPISVSLVIALETFVGEKERGSIETLLNTPLQDWQLYLGKLLAAVIPPLITSYMGMAVYMAGIVLQGIRIPDLDVMALIVILTTVQATVMVAGAVVVSSQATSVRAANLLASFIIIPMALLIQGESVVMFWGDLRVLWWAVIGQIFLGFLLARVGLAHFQREELLGREIDVLNARWMWNTFKQGFKGQAHNIREWILKEVPKEIKTLGKPSILVTVIGISGIILGVLLINQNQDAIREYVKIQPNGTSGLNAITGFSPLLIFTTLLAIFWQNVRAMLIALGLGVVTLGILGVLPLFLTMGTVGAVMAFLSISGNSMPIGLFILGGLLPHGILEIPAAILASAAILKSGASLATPTPTRTVGEVWLFTLGSWFKVMIGAVMPMLFVAAAIEAWVTPLILASLLKLYS